MTRAGAAILGIAWGAALTRCIAIVVYTLPVFIKAGSADIAGIVGFAGSAVFLIAGLAHADSFVHRLIYTDLIGTRTGIRITGGMDDRLKINIRFDIWIDINIAVSNRRLIIVRFIAIDNGIAIVNTVYLIPVDNRAV